jgi:hypothetical protein
MAIVIDSNCLAHVFSRDDQDHHEFSPVLEFVNAGLGSLIYGGKTYLQELSRAPRFARLIRLLRDQGRAIHINDDAVDAAQRVIEGKINDARCDDPHIIALLATSNCGLLCSRDGRSFRYVKDPALYHRHHVGVRIYTGRRNVDLLVPQRQNLWNKDP